MIFMLPQGIFLLMEHVAQDRLMDLQLLRLPITLAARSMANPMLDRRAQWRIIEWDPITKSAYGIVGGSNLLFKFDVHHGVEGAITPLAQLVPAAKRAPPSCVCCCAKRSSSATCWFPPPPVNMAALSCGRSWFAAAV